MPPDPPDLEAIVRDALAPLQIVDADGPVIDRLAVEVAAALAPHVVLRSEYDESLLMNRDAP